MKIQINRKGAAMVMVVCMMALITALCLGLLLSTSVVLTSAQNEADREQSRVYAISLSKQIEQELTVKQEGELWEYLKIGIQTGEWPYFNDEERGHTARYAHRIFDLSGVEVGADEIQVLIYWESSSNAKLDGSQMAVQVTCITGKESTVVTSKYTLDCPDTSSDVWNWSLNWRE